jgi:hypothetical protein
MSSIGCATYAVPARAFSDVIIRLAADACLALEAAPAGIVAGTNSRNWLPHDDEA